jgi:hypothetical protein
VIVWIGTAVYGLAGPSGLPRWRCDIPWAQATGMSTPPTARLLATDDPAGLPRVLSQWEQSGLGQRNTVLQQAWPTRPDGRYLVPTPVSMTYEPEPALIAPGQPLPWAGENWWVALILPASGILCLIVVVVPGFLVYRLAGSRTWVAGLAAVAYAAFATLVITDPVVFPLAIFLAAAVPGQLFVAALRRKSRELWLLVVIAVAASVGTFLYKLQTVWHPSLTHGHALDSLGQLALVTVSLGVAAVPMVFLMFAAIGWFRRRAWKKLAWLLGWSVVLAVVIAAVSLLVKRSAAWSDPVEPYSRQGWYLVVPIGLYAAGTLMLLWIVLKAGFRLLRRAAVRLRRQPKTA